VARHRMGPIVARPPVEFLGAVPWSIKGATCGASASELGMRSDEIGRRGRSHETAPNEGWRRNAGRCHPSSYRGANQVNPTSLTVLAPSATGDTLHVCFQSSSARSTGGEPPCRGALARLRSSAAMVVSRAGTLRPLDEQSEFLCATTPAVVSAAVSALPLR
jgi:hypothetical protein